MSPTLADLLRSAPFELVLSSGFFGFYAHAGVVEALEEAKLRPTLVGGSSAGALIAGLWGAGLPAAKVRERLLGLQRQDFWDPDPLFGFGGNGPGLLRGAAFDGLLESALSEIGVRTFADCAMPVRVVAYDIDRRVTVVLDRGDLATAVRASCSFPGLFQPRHIDGVRYLDGGIGDRSGISVATPGARLLFHHLMPQSPWRLVMSSQNEPPTWPDMYLLAVDDLPRLNPFRLKQGREACEKAYAMAKRMLNSPARAARR